VENMAKIILASHGGLSKGMKDSVSMIVGDLAKDIETYSLLPGQNPEDFYQEVLKEAKECEEQILILCDIKGGSVHTALSKLAVLDNVMVFSGMNMGLVLDAVMKGLNGKLELAEATFDQTAKDGMTIMNGMTSKMMKISMGEKKMIKLLRWITDCYMVKLLFLGKMQLKQIVS
ncbi:MAG: PTS sugar transporter subunit IIA, partial [Faecalibacillus intestinalis]|uniref:PTS sugar transporter subunit IIA n=1 Tax=Faecalibacillus intestinalis TaxID=1982626 RepID=UPI00399BE015